MSLDISILEGLLSASWEQLELPIFLMSHQEDPKLRLRENRKKIHPILACNSTLHVF